jgi:hypothetical protein
MQVGSQLGLDMTDTQAGLEMLQACKTDDFMATTGAILSQWEQRQAEQVGERGRVLTGAQVRQMYGVDVNPDDLYNLKPDGTLSREVAAGGAEQAMTPYQREQVRQREADQELQRQKMEAAAQELPPDLLKYQIEQDNQYQMAASASESAYQLADAYEQSVTTAGIGARFDEFIKETLGGEDAVTEVRQQYRKLRNSLVLGDLPPGVASDKDIEIAMSGYPKDTANPQYVASFLRGMGKLNRFRAAQALYNKNYLSQNRKIDKKDRHWKAPVKFTRVGADGKEVTGKTSLAEIYWASLEAGVPVPEAMRILGVTDKRVLDVVGYGDE